MNLVSYDFWIILFYISIASFVLLVGLMIILRLRKNEYLHVYHNDDIFKTFIESGVKNEIYGVNGEVKNYIKRYVIRISQYDTSLIANYQGKHRVISYFVVCYNKKKKECGVIQVTERNNNETGKIIGLPHRTKFVNIVLKRVDDMEFSSSIIKPIPVFKIRIYSLLFSLSFFSLAYVLRHLVCLIMGSEYLREYYTSFWNFYAFLAMILMTLIIYFISVISLRAKSSKNRSGGIRYEFN